MFHVAPEVLRPSSSEGSRSQSLPTSFFVGVCVVCPLSVILLLDAVMKLSMKKVPRVFN